MYYIQLAADCFYDICKRDNEMSLPAMYVYTN